MAYILQGTIMDNLLDGVNHRPTQEEIEKACERVGILSLIRSTPNKFDAHVGVGVASSDGFIYNDEALKLMLANGLLKKNQVFVLEEPTKEMLDALKGETVLYFAKQHVNEEDIMHVVANGEVTRSGPVEQLWRSFQADYGNKTDRI